MQSYFCNKNVTIKLQQQVLYVYMYFAIPKRELNKLSNDTKLLKIELLFWKYKTKIVSFLITSQLYFPSISQSKPGRHKVPFVVMVSLQRVFIEYQTICDVSSCTLVIRLWGPNISGENKASCYYPVLHLLKYDTRVVWFDCECYYPLFSCLITMWPC